MAMKTRRIIKLLIAVILVGVIVFLAVSVERVNVVKPTVQEEYHLSDIEIHDLSLSANSGDGDAAYKLALYYRLSVNDPDKAEMWFLRARELGVTEADSWLETMRNAAGRKSLLRPGEVK